MSDITMKELHAKGLAIRRAKAAARRAKVKALKEQGYTGPQIAAELGVKIRLVHHDFAILKKEQNENKAAEKA